MPLNHDDLEKVEAEALRTVRDAGVNLSPTELIMRLKDEGWPEGMVRVATWYLIDRREIQLSRNWKLSPAESVA